MKADRQEVEHGQYTCSLTELGKFDYRECRLRSIISWVHRSYSALRSSNQEHWQDSCPGKAYPGSKQTSYSVLRRCRHGP